MNHWWLILPLFLNAVIWPWVIYRGFALRRERIEFDAICRDIHANDARGNS